MDVIIDGQRNFKMQGEPPSLLAAVSAIADFLRENGRDIVSLSVDGRAVRPEEISSKFADLPASGVGTIEVGSEETLVMVMNCLREIESVLPELPNACQGLAQVFQGESPMDGFEPFQELAEMWSHIKRREALVSRILAIDVDQTLLEGRSLAQVQQELNSFLEEAAQALKDGDCVLLGDLLEYELAPRAEQEAQIVALLRQHAPG